MFDCVAHTGSGTNGGKPKIETGDISFSKLCLFNIYIQSLKRELLEIILVKFRYQTLSTHTGNHRNPLAIHLIFLKMVVVTHLSSWG